MYLLPVFSCNLKYSGNISLGTSCRTLNETSEFKSIIVKTLKQLSTYFIACQLTAVASLLVKWTMCIWTAYWDITTSHTAVGIHLHTLSKIWWNLIMYFKHVSTSWRMHTCWQNLHPHAFNLNHSFGIWRQRRQTRSSWRMASMLATSGFLIAGLTVEQTVRDLIKSHLKPQVLTVSHLLVND